MQEIINKIIEELIRKNYTGLMKKNKTDRKKKKENKSSSKNNSKRFRKILLLFFLLAVLPMSGIVCKDGEKTVHNPLIKFEKEQNNTGINMPKVIIF